MATRTSNGTGGGVFSAGATWVGGVAPVDGDAFVIANGDTVTFDMDQSAWAGMAASTINAGGTLIASTTAGAYVLKMNANLNVNGTLQAGTSVAVPYPSTCTFTINYSNAAYSTEVSATGHLYLYCAQPTNKYVTLDNQELSGATVLNIEEDLTGDTTLWAANAVVCVVDSTALDVQYCTIASVDAGTKTITILDTGAAPLDALDSNVEDKSLIVLVSRNIKISNVAASDNAITYANTTTAGNGDYIGAEITNCYRGIRYGSGFNFAGTTNLLTTSAYALYQSEANVTISGFLTGPGISTSLGISGASGVTITGLLAGWGQGLSSVYGSSVSGRTFGCTAGTSGTYGCILTSTGVTDYCTNGWVYPSSLTVYGVIRNCTQRQIQSGTDIVLANTTIGPGSSIADIDYPTNGRAYNVTFSSATEVGSYSVAQRSLNAYFESFNHDGTENAFMAWPKGGIITSQTASPPTGYTIFYDHEVESATLPCFRQYLTTVLPGTAIEVSAVIRNTDGIDVSATSPIDLRPRLEIIDVFADPLVDSTQTALDSDPIAVSNGTNTDWQAVDVIWANTGDSPRQVYVRIICYSHDASTHTIDEAWSIAGYQQQIATILSTVTTNVEIIKTHLTDIKGTGFAKDTDSLVDLAHTGADGDTLETLSDQIDAVQTDVTVVDGVADEAIERLKRIGRYP